MSEALLVFDSGAGQDGPSCSACVHRHMRKLVVGTVTIHIGKPELRCKLSGQFHSPELPRACPHFERAA